MNRMRFCKIEKPPSFFEERKWIALQSYSLMLSLFSLLICGDAFAQSRTIKKRDTRQGKVGKGVKQISRKTCLVPVKARNMNEGDLAEVVDAGLDRIAVVRLQRRSNQPDKLVAEVLVGSEKCSTLSGYSIRPLTPSSMNLTSDGFSATPTVASAVMQYVVTQYAIPGLALNKFLSPGYTQRGFALRAGSTFPRQAKLIGKFKFQGSAGLLFASSSTAPAIDIIKEGKVLGTQKITAQNLQIRAGARALTFDSKLWTEAGAILFNSLSSKSSLAKSSSEVDALFQSIREVSGQGFGVYAEQGAIVGNNLRLSLLFALGLGNKYKTPIIEDADASNTTENFNSQGLPIFSTLSVNFPIYKGMYSELNFDYSNMKLQLPLINEQVSNAQIETLGFSLGAGYRF